MYLSGDGKASDVVSWRLARQKWSLPLWQIATPQTEARKVRTASQVGGGREEKGAHHLPCHVGTFHLCLPPCLGQGPILLHIPNR